MKDFSWSLVKESESTLVCATGVFFLSLFSCDFDDNWVKICNFMHMTGYIKWEYWSLTITKGVQFLSLHCYFDINSKQPGDCIVWPCDVHHTFLHDRKLWYNGRFYKLYYPLDYIVLQQSNWYKISYPLHSCITCIKLMNVVVHTKWLVNISI